MLFLFISLSLFGIVHNDCPKICSVCLTKTIICEYGGFTEFPTKFQSETENITLVGHHFNSNILSPANLSGIIFPLKLRYLAIRGCSIQEVLSYTFSRLNSLEILDLSENQILNIHDYAFEGLSIQTLKLNDIGKLKLYPESFSKLSLKVLSIKSSHLSVLDYSVFSRLNQARFEILQLSNNNFRTIDRQFEPIIRNLKQVDLHGNPIVCNCSLLWLKKMSGFRIIFPKCVSPSNLRSKLLSEIDESEFKCEPPKISEIKVNFLSHVTAELFCTVDTKSSKTGQVSVSWISNFKTNPVPEVMSHSVASIKINKSRFSIDNDYKCIAENKIGQSSIIVTLDWPIKWNSWKTNLSIPIDYSQTLDNNSWATSFYFKKRYTLVELIVAVISTFITTILLFLITYKICIQNSGCAAFSDKPYISHQKFLSHQKGFSTGYPPFRFNTTENGLHTAESNSQTYDCISINNALYPHQLSNTLPGPFIDYKTHKRLYSPKIVVD